MTRALAAALAVFMFGISAFAFLRERPPREAGAQFAAFAVGEETGHTCRTLVSTTPAVDISRAQEQVRAAARGDRREMGRKVIALDAILRCALLVNPADGGILALMAWTSWRLNAPIERIARLLAESYRLHPFEDNTLAIRQLVIAANWDRLGADIHAIGRSDQSLRFAIGRAVIVVPELARLYLEAGTSSDLYHEALDHIARTAPDLLAQFEAVVAGEAKP
jgi:hypothetical protein